MPGNKLSTLNIEDILQTGISGSLTMADQSSSLSSPVQDDSQMSPAISLSQTMERKDYFNKLLVIFLKEFPESRNRPLPVILPPQKIVDLYELLIIVKKEGGFDTVTSKQMWSSVSVDLGFDPTSGPGLKLIYSKYLKMFDKWMQTADNIPKNGLNSDDHGVKGNRTKSPVTPKGDTIQIRNASPVDGTGQMESPIVIADDDEQVSSVHNVSKQTLDDNSESGNLKRKCREFDNILEWIRNVAKNPCKIVSKDHEQWFQDHISQCIGIRKLLFFETPCSNAGNGSNSQKRVRVHPSLYEQSVPANPEVLERLRSRSHDKRNNTPVFAQSPSVAPSEISSATANHTQTRDPASAASSSVKSFSQTHCIQYLDRAIRKRIALGNLHQAVIPSMPNPTEQQSQNLDQREIMYLGTVEYSPKSGKRRSADRDRVGKGRADSCPCQFPGSVDCVREHIQQEKERLMAELGPLFNAWKFNEMGEDVAKSWSKEEEQRFRAIVRLNPSSLGQDFWNELPAAFPLRSRRECVSYYFNVFVLRRRSIQNRVMPDQIDSDDDEAEYTVAGNLRMNKPSGQSGKSNYMLCNSGMDVCQENKQCTIDLTEEGTSKSSIDSKNTNCDVSHVSQ